MAHPVLLTVENVSENMVPTSWETSSSRDTVIRKNQANDCSAVRPQVRQVNRRQAGQECCAAVEMKMNKMSGVSEVPASSLGTKKH